MKKLAVSGLALFLMIATVTPVSAAKSPGPPELAYAGYLGGIATQITGVNERLTTLLNQPPEPDYPPDPGFAGHLEAIANQLEGIQTRLSRPPGPPDVPPPDPDRTAVGTILDEANGIVGTVSEFQAGSPTVRLALGEISDTAAAIANIARGLLNQTIDQ